MFVEHVGDDDDNDDKHNKVEDGNDNGKNSSCVLLPVGTGEDRFVCTTKPFIPMARVERTTRTFRDIIVDRL